MAGGLTIVRPPAQPSGGEHRLSGSHDGEAVMQGPSGNPGDGVLVMGVSINGGNPWLILVGIW